MELPLPWAAWNSTARDQQDMTTWNKTEWQFWLRAYIDYYDLFALYLVTENATMNATDGTGIILPNLNLTSNSSSAGNDSSNNSLAVTTSSGLVVEFLSFSDFWSASFNQDSILIADIIAELNATSAIVEECSTWFTAFFGPSGYVTLNITLAVEVDVGGNDTLPVVNSDIPEGLEDIVAWIKAQFEIELRRRCPQCYYNTTSVDNSTNSTSANSTSNNSTVNSTVPVVNTTVPVVNTTVPVDNTTVPIDDNSTLPVGPGSGAGAPLPPVDNSTDNGTDISPVDSLNGSDTNSTPSFPEGGYNLTDNRTGSALPENSTTTTTTTTTLSYFNSGNYSLPTNCAYQTTDKTSIKCSQGIMRSVGFTFTQLNEYWEDDLSNVCSDAQTKFNSCKTNSVISSQNTCFYLSYYNAFQLHGDTKFYGFLYFDSSALAKAYSYCSSKYTSSFSLTSAQFTTGFQFPFGTIN